MNMQNSLSESVVSKTEKLSTLLAVFLIALALRLIAIDVPINSDEGLWMYRGTAFARHLLNGELAETYLRHHPGVTNMWLIGSSMFLNCLWHKLHPQFWGIDQPASVGACLNQMNFTIGLWILPRIFQAVLTAGCMVIIYDLVRRLVGKPIALTAIGLLTLEPFFLAYQRYLTTDALQADFGAIALLAMLVYLSQPVGDLGSHSRSYKWLLLSGGAMGLSIMAKIPSIFFIPAVLTWLVVIELRSGGSFPQRGWRRQGKDFALWLLTIGCTAVLIWPALWVAPVETLGQLLDGLRAESQRGAFFYLGQTTDAIGLSFYPLTLLYRLSPLFLLGLVMWVVMAVKKQIWQDQRSLLQWLLMISVIWVLGLLSLSDSKIDRYINLVIPLLVILAAAGWVWLWSELAAVVKQGQPTRILATGVGGMLLIQSVVVVSYQPYYLTYFNPIVDLFYPAEQVFMIGQGEGLEQAAWWLNQSGDAEDMTVATLYDRAFRPYFIGQVINIPKFTSSKPPDWLNANRIALYINQYQRSLPDSAMLDYFSAQPLLHSVRLHGLDYVKVYPGPVATPKDLAAISKPQSLEASKVNDVIQFYGYDYSASDQILQVTTYWEFAETLPPGSKLMLKIGNAGAETTVTADRLVGGYLEMENVPQNIPLRDSQRIPLQSLAPGEYALTATWKLPSPSFSSGREVSLEVSLGAVAVRS